MRSVATWLPTIVLCAISLGFSSCVTPVRSAASKDGAFAVSCKENDRGAGKRVAIVECSFINNTGTPADFELARMSLPATYRGRVASPTDIQRYMDNPDGGDASNVAALGLLVIGGVAVAGGGGPSAAGVGGVALIGAMPTTKKTQMEGSSGQRGDYSAQHMLSGPFLVHGQQMVAKSAVLALNDVGALPVTMELCFIQPDTECLPVAVEAWVGRSRLRGD